MFDLVKKTMLTGVGLASIANKSSASSRQIAICFLALTKLSEASSSNWFMSTGFT